MRRWILSGIGDLAGFHQPAANQTNLPPSGGGAKRAGFGVWTSGALAFSHPVASAIDIAGVALLFRPFHMSILIGIATFVLILISLFLILVVLAQKAKSDGGMGAAMGGGMAEAAFGADTGNVLSKATINASIAFFLLSFLVYLGQVYQHKHGATSAGALPNIPVSSAPAVPAPSATPATPSAATPAPTTTSTTPAAAPTPVPAPAAASSTTTPPPAATPAPAPVEAGKK